MAIFIDPTRWPAHGTLWSHLICDGDLEELHEFARILGIPRRGFDMDHYDVSASNYQKAISLGAKEISSKDTVHILQETGIRVKQADKKKLRPAFRRDYLISEWMNLGHKVATFSDRFTVSEWSNTGQELIARWNEDHRKYHDERHLEDVILSLDQLAVSGEEIAVETFLAAWFHDAIYKGEVETDELESAKLATYILNQFEISDSIIQTVHNAIISTSPLRNSEQVDRKVAHLLDADLAIFAANDARYQEYAQSVRNEYIHVPDEIFTKERINILQSYLNKTHIFSTDQAQRLWEARSRNNIKKEISQLQLEA